jgi:sodium/bile acid cotransporter 7
MQTINPRLAGRLQRFGNLGMHRDMELWCVAAAFLCLQQLGGNVSLALLLTVTTNILGIFTMPFILPHMANAAALTPPAAAAAAAAIVTLEPLPLMLQLCQTILVPTMLGASVRGLVPGAAAAIDRNKKMLSYINAGLLASVPWMQVGQVACYVVNPKPMYQSRGLSDLVTRY